MTAVFSTRLQDDKTLSDVNKIHKKITAILKYKEMLQKAP